MNIPAAVPDRDQPFHHSLLQALVSEWPWNDLSALVVESWIRLAGASAALLVSPLGATKLQVISCRAIPGSEPQTGLKVIPQSFAALLNRGTVVETLAESGLIGGLSIEVSIWLDLAAALILQFPDDAAGSSTEHVGMRSTLIPVCRRLLSRATDRAVLLPDSDLLEAMAEYAAGAGHEINNPLGSILGQTQLLLKNDTSPERSQTYETIGAQAWRIRDMIGNSMLFARPPQPQKKDLDLVETTQEILHSLGKLAEESEIELTLTTTSRNIRLVADRAQLCTMISHLVRNSIEALRSMDRSGTISVVLKHDSPSAIEISVVDDGPGIVSEAVRRHIFNPFYSGRSAGRGLGFGLCLAWQIVRMHDGLILHETPTEGGTAFHVALPKSAS